MTDSVSEKVKNFSAQFGSMVNTLLLIVAIGAVGYNWRNSGADVQTSIAAVDRRVERLSDKVDTIEKASANKWTEHLDFHRQRATEVTQENTSLKERVSSTERDVRKYDELAIKQTQTETNVRSLQESIKSIETQVNSLTSTLGIQTEILKRIEQRVNRP